MNEAQITFLMSTIIPATLSAIVILLVQTWRDNETP